MKRTILTIFIIFAVIFNFACPMKRRAKLKDLWGQTFAITNRGLTPQGANLWQADGTIITGEDIAAVDEGLQRLFDKCKCQISEMDGKPFSQAVTHAEYIVAILKSTDVDSNGDPAIRVPAAQYKGTIYDKGGYILIAGQMLAIGKPYGNIMAIPDHNSNFKRLSDITEYEGEHIAAGWNAPTVARANETHGAGSGHPFIPSCGKSAEVEKPGKTYEVGSYDTPHGKSLILLTK